METLDYIKREEFKFTMNQIEAVIRVEMQLKPHLRELKNSNDLIRTIWHVMNPNVKAETILRLARNVRKEGYDTKDNQENRANAETAYREYNHHS